MKPPKQCSRESYEMDIKWTSTLYWWYSVKTYYRFVFEEHSLIHKLFLSISVSFNKRWYRHCFWKLEVPTYKTKAFCIYFQLYQFRKVFRRERDAKSSRNRALCFQVWKLTNLISIFNGIIFFFPSSSIFFF